MLRTSIAAVVLGCFYFCALHCDASVMVVDCAAVETGCMLEKYIPAKGCNKIRAHFFFGRGAAAAAAACCCCCPHQYSSEERHYFFFFGGCAGAALHSSIGMW